MEELGNINVRKKDGSECFSQNNEPLQRKLIDFWSWYSSDLLNNTLRGVLAEYLVMHALSIEANHRVEWEPYDIETDLGLRIEIKSSAYLQSWHQTRLSKISFGIPSTRDLDKLTNSYSNTVVRQSHVYVFCVLHHQDKSTVDPMNVDQWTFYVLETAVLNEKCPNQKTIQLSALLKLEPTICRFDQLKEVIVGMENIYTKSAD